MYGFRSIFRHLSSWISLRCLSKIACDHVQVAGGLQQQIRPRIACNKLLLRLHDHTSTRTHCNSPISRTFSRSHVHTYTRTHVHTYTRSHIHTFTRFNCFHVPTFTHSHDHTFACSHVHTLTRSPAHTFARSHIHTSPVAYQTPNCLQSIVVTITRSHVLMFTLALTPVIDLLYDITRTSALRRLRRVLCNLCVRCV
jgi:hypothetical protein